MILPFSGRRIYYAAETPRRSTPTTEKKREKRQKRT